MLKRYRVNHSQRRHSELALVGGEGIRFLPTFSLLFLTPQCKNIAVELKVVSTDGKYSYFFFLFGNAFHTV